MIFVTFSGASPTSAAKLGEYRRQLFMGPPVTREVAKKMEDSSSTNVSGTHNTQLTMAWSLLVKTSTMTCGRSNRRQPSDAIHLGLNNSGDPNGRKLKTCLPSSSRRSSPCEEKWLQTNRIRHNKQRCPRTRISIGRC